jgi:hypothetical protein
MTLRPQAGARLFVKFSTRARRRFHERIFDAKTQRKARK